MYPLPGLLVDFTLDASDVESDALTYSAPILPGGRFDPATRRYTWTVPTSPPEATYYAKFRVTEPTGGTDNLIVEFVVSPLLHASTTTQPGAAESRDGAVAGLPAVEGPNPASVSFSLATPLQQGVRATLTVFYLRGRRVAAVEGPSGMPLVWDIRKTGDVEPGIYFYRVKVGRSSRTARSLWCGDAPRVSSPSCGCGGRICPLSGDRRTGVRDRRRMQPG